MRCLNKPEPLDYSPVNSKCQHRKNNPLTAPVIFIFTAFENLPSHEGMHLKSSTQKVMNNFWGASAHHPILQDLVALLPLRFQQYPHQLAMSDWMRSGPVFWGHVLTNADPSIWTLVDQKHLVYNNWNGVWGMEDVEAGRTAGALSVDLGLSTNLLGSVPALREAAESSFGLADFLSKQISADEFDEL
jgi:hypothetical protein